MQNLFYAQIAKIFSPAARQPPKQSIEEQEGNPAKSTGGVGRTEREGKERGCIEISCLESGSEDFAARKRQVKGKTIAPNG